MSSYLETPATQLTVPATYRRDWGLFTVWCTAHDLQPLPASTVTVARFLGFEPHLAIATLRRRVTAINQIHVIAGYDAPGTTTAIRRKLSARDHHADRARNVIGDLPTTGWPAGLFGRRDALILALVCITGIPIPGTSTLTCGDITYRCHDSTLNIGAGHDITVPATTDPHGLYAVWRRWAVLRDRMLRYPSPRAWAHALHTAIPVPTSRGVATAFEGGGPSGPYRGNAALFPPLDRWGQSRTFDPAASISSRAVSYVIAGCLNGSSAHYSHKSNPSYVPEQQTPCETAYPGVDTPAPLNAPAADGARAQRLALTDLAALDPVFVDIDNRTSQLLARTE